MNKLFTAIFLLIVTIGSSQVKLKQLELSGGLGYTIYTDGNGQQQYVLFSSIVNDTLTLAALNYWTLNGNHLYPDNTTDSVGIGQATAAALLDVAGDALINGATLGLGSANSIFNIVFGTEALENNTLGGAFEGIGQIAIGYQALQANTTGGLNTAVGYLALQTNTTSSYNTALGALTLQKNTIGESNTAFGYSSLFDNTEGDFNVGIGNSTLQNNTIGDQNLALGVASMLNNTIGSYNVGIGFQSLWSMDTGTNNMALGYKAGYSNDASNNIFIGNEAGYFETGGLTLYIEPTNSSTPLIYGSFASDSLVINGDLHVTGVFLDSNEDPGGQDSILTSTATGTDWQSLSDLGLTTIYTGDGTLAGDRDVALGGYDLGFTGGNIGIGTASPQGVFHLESTVGLIRLSDSNAATDQATQGGITLYRGNNTNRVGGLQMISVGDTRFGLYTDFTAGELSFHTGDLVEAMRIDESQNVGIGISSPAELLDVNGAIHLATASTPTPHAGDIYSNADGNLYYYDGVLAAWQDLTAGAAGSTNIYTSDGSLGGNRDVDLAGFDLGFDTNTLFIDATAAAVGIGTIDPSTRFEVTDPAIPSFTGNTNGNFSIKSDAFVHQTYQTIDFVKSESDEDIIGRIALEMTNTGSLLHFGTSNLYNSGITNDALVINESGNVGIGTTSPDEPFDIEFTDATGGVIGSKVKNLSTSTNLSYAGVTVQAENGTVISDWLSVPTAGSVLSGGGMVFRTRTNHPIAFQTNLNERMRIGTDGGLNLDEYGVNTFAGTPAYSLGVDASGNVVEFATGGTSFTWGLGLLDEGGSTIALDFSELSAAAVEDDGTEFLVLYDNNASPNEELTELQQAVFDVVSGFLTGNTETNITVTPQGDNTIDFIASGGGGYWSQTGSNVYLTTDSDSVGIGTETPNVKLDVVSAFTAADIIEMQAGAQVWAFSVDDNGAGFEGFQIWDNVAINNPFNIEEGAVDDNFYIESATGDIGILTTDPTQELDINGDLRVRNTIYDSDNISGTNGKFLSHDAGGILWVDSPGGGGADGNGIFDSSNDGTNVDPVDADFDIGIAAGDDINFDSGLLFLAGDEGTVGIGYNGVAAGYNDLSKLSVSKTVDSNYPLVNLNVDNLDDDTYLSFNNFGEVSELGSWAIGRDDDGGFSILHDTDNLFNQTDAGAYKVVTIEDGASTNSIYVDGDGNIGLGEDSDANTRLQVSSSASTDIVKLEPRTVIIGSNASSSSARLEIGDSRALNGNAYIDLISDNTTYTDYGLRIQRASGVNSTTQFAHRGTGDLQFLADEAASILFHTDSNLGLELDATGDVAVIERMVIGGSASDASPSLLIKDYTGVDHTDVILTNTSATKDIDLVYENTGDSSTDSYILSRENNGDFALTHFATGISTPTNYPFYYDESNNNIGMFDQTPDSGHKLDVAGAIRCTSLTETSDIRLKENVRLIDKPIEKLMDLSGYTFNLIGEENRQAGVIAQELEKVLPEAVSTGDDGFKSVSYSQINALLIEAIKEQQKQIEDLQKRISKLEK